MQPENVPTATRKRNIALLGVLAVIILLLYALTVTKFGDSAKNAMSASGEQPTSEQAVPAAQ